MRRIAPGEEVNTAYTDLAATRWERRRELLHHHVFDIAAAAPAPAPAAPAHAASTSSGPATGSAAAGGAAAALQCLPGQPPEAAAALPAVDAELRLYRCGLPPWPHDERDVDLTAVSSSSFSTVVGMWGSLGHEDSLGAVPAAASFGMRQADGEGDEASASAAAACEAAGAPPPAALVHCWGPSLAAPLPEVQQLAERYMAALRLQRSLDDLLASGRAAAAVARLQQALAELCGEPWPGSSRSITSGGGEAAMSLGPRHVLRMRLLADLHRAAVAAGDWDAALQSAHLLLPLYQAGYPPVRCCPLLSTCCF